MVSALLGHGYRLAAASRRRVGCCEMNPVNASRTTSASDRRSENAIARSASCCSASMAAKSVTGSESFLSPTRVPRRGAPALLARSVFIANLLFTDDQVLDRTNKFQIDGLLPEPFPQHVARVGSQPVARLRRVGHIPLDQCQHVSIDNALIPPNPRGGSWRKMKSVPPPKRRASSSAVSRNLSSSIDAR